MKIWELLVGYEKAHGSYAVKRTNAKGKAEGQAYTHPGPATEGQWLVHLSGQGAGVGIIPLLADDTVRWCCGDVDVYNLDHAELEKKIEKLKLPLVMTRSKSGGAHCFLFLKEPEPAKDIRNLMEKWMAALGYGGCEVFPKQIARFDDKDVGNWLNMPYFYAEKTVRYCIRDGKRLSLDEFTEYAESRRTTLAEIQASVNQHLNGVDIDEGAFPHGPPCLQFIQANGGFVQGTMKDGMFNVAVYLKKKDPDAWQEKLAEYNTIMCNPPLKLPEVNALVKQVAKKAYSYRCKLAPINAHCQRSVCLSRELGVGESPETAGYPEIGMLTRHIGDPVIWFLDIDDKRVMFTTEELVSQHTFGIKVASAIGRLPAAMPQPRWRKYLDDKMRDSDTIETPVDASPTGQFELLVKQYLTGQAQATSKEELAHRMTPFRTGTGEIWFRSRGLLDYLATHNFKYPSEHHVWQMLRSMGVESRPAKAGGVKINVWVMKDPGEEAQEAPLPEFGTKEF